MEGLPFAGGSRAASSASQQETVWGFAEASGPWGAAQGLPKRKSSLPLSARGSIDAAQLGELAIGDGLHAAKKRCCSASDLAGMQASQPPPAQLPLAAAVPLSLAARTTRSAPAPRQPFGELPCAAFSQQPAEAAATAAAAASLYLQQQLHAAQRQRALHQQQPPAQPGLPPRHPNWPAGGAAHPAARHPPPLRCASAAVPASQQDLLFAPSGQSAAAEARLRQLLVQPLPAAGGTGLRGLLPAAQQQQRHAPALPQTRVWAVPAPPRPSPATPGFGGASAFSSDSQEEAWETEAFGALECEESLEGLEAEEGGVFAEEWEADDASFHSAASHASTLAAPGSGLAVGAGAGAPPGCLRVDPPPATLEGHGFVRQAAAVAVGYPVAADPGHLLAAGVPAFGGVALAATPATLPAAAPAVAAAAAVSPAAALPAAPAAVPVFNVKELREANAMLCTIRTPEGRPFIPVHEADCLIPLVTLYRIPPICIALGASYFQRLLARDDMRELMASCGFFVHVPSGLPRTPGNARSVVMMRACTGRPDSPTLLGAYLACIYLAAKVADRVQYSGMLSAMLGKLFGSTVEPHVAEHLELSVATSLGWRLGPYFDLGPHLGPH